MEKVNEVIVTEAKEFIEWNDLPALQAYIYELLHETEFETAPDWGYCYQKIVLHASLKKRHEIVTWLKTLFEQFDPIQKIAMRQMFSYANWLENTRGNCQPKQ